MKAAALLGLALVISMVGLPAAALAQQIPQVKVKVDDLDLTRDAGVHTANNRLEQGIRSQCPQAEPDLKSQKEAQNCRNELRARGRGKIAAAAAKSDADKLAEQRSLAEVSIHPRRVRRAPVYHRTPGQVAEAHHAVVRHPAAHKVVRHAAARHPVARNPVKAQHKKR